MTPIQLITLIAIFFLTSVISVVTGSTSLITVPAMLQFGIEPHLAVATNSRTLKVRGGIISQANRYLGGFCSSQGIFPPQIIQVLLTVAFILITFRVAVNTSFIGTLRASPFLA